MPQQLDAINAAVVRKIADRAKQGMETYGQTMERKDISTLEWLKKAQEEALDFLVYSERVIQDLEAEEAKKAIEEARKPRYDFKYAYNHPDWTRGF